MITVKDSVRTPLDPDAAFEYVSDFTHTADWDPGTPVVRQETPGAVGVGTKYYAEAEFKGKRQPIEYVVTELRPRRIVLRGENKRVISVDSIVVEPAGAGSTVTYTAEFTLKGIARLAEPFVGGTFRKLAGPAIAGLQRTLDDLAKG